jgi:hypothetical protein
MPMAARSTTALVSFGGSSDICGCEGGCTAMVSFVVIIIFYGMNKEPATAHLALKGAFIRGFAISYLSCDALGSPGA